MHPTNLLEVKPENYRPTNSEKPPKDNVPIVTQTNAIFINTIGHPEDSSFSKPFDKNLVSSEKKIFLPASPRKDNVKDPNHVGKNTPTRTNTIHQKRGNEPLLIRKSEDTLMSPERIIYSSKSLDSINSSNKTEPRLFNSSQEKLEEISFNKSNKVKINASIKKIKEELLILNSNQNIYLSKKVCMLNEWYLILKICTGVDSLSDDQKSEIDKLSSEVDQLGQISVAEYFYTMQRFIIDKNISSELSYPLTFWSILSRILIKYPHTYHWIKNFDSDFLIRLTNNFYDSLCHSYDYSLEIYKEKGDYYIQSNMATLLSDCYLICYAFSPQNIDFSPNIDPSQKKQGLVWKNCESLLFEKLNNHWRTTSPPDTMPKIVNLNDFFSKICKKGKEDLHEELAFSLAYTFVVLRIDIISCFDYEALDQLFRAENVKNYLKETINFSEKISSFVEFSILAKEEPEKRAHLMEAFIAAAMNCLELGDIESCAAIQRGVSQSSIQRLKHTRKLVSERASSNEKKIESLFSFENNFSEYRKFLKDKMTCVIPNLAVILKDLEFATTGNEDDSKKKWQDKIGDKLIQLIYFTKVRALYLKTTGQRIYPIPDLKTILRDESFKFTEDSSNSPALLIRSKYLEPS